MAAKLTTTTPIRATLKAGAILAALSLTAIEARAATVPDAIFTSTASYANSAIPPFDISVSNSISTAGTVTVDNGGYASVVNYPNPTLTVQAFGAGGSNPYPVYYGFSSAQVQYFAVINGPDAVIPIDLSYSGFFNESGPEHATGQAYVSLNTGGLGVGGNVYRSDLDTSPYSGTLSGSVSSGTQFSILLNALVQTGELDGDYAFLRLDPVLSIDPSFAAVDPNYLNDYTITLSSGIGNAPDGIPEPGVWAMLLLGFGALGAQLRHKRLPLRAV